jgi:tRNA(fMet)-specific endonuclease VapC
MTLYILDSDTIRLFRDKDPKVEARFDSVTAPDKVATTVITVHESVMGWHTYLLKARGPADIEFGYRELARSVRGFTTIAILECTVAGIGRFENLKRLRLNVGKNDLRIAAIALEAGGIVVTRNLRDFRRLPGLVCEDWSV